MTYEEAENILQTYSLEELLDFNDLVEEDILCFLVEEKFISLPEVEPL